MALTKVKNSVTSFTQDGTGAVERGMEDKLREVVSVKDFGADPANTGSENSTAFQAAVDSGAATVYIPAGEYTLSETWIIPQFVNIKGEGPENTTLFSTATGSAITNTAYWFHQVFDGFCLSHKTATGTNDIDMIYALYGANSCIFRNLRLQAREGVTRDGLVVRGYNGSTANNNQYNNLFENIRTHATDGTANYSSGEIVGTALWLYGEDINAARANSNVVIGGTYDGFETGLDVNGNGNSFISFTINGPATGSAIIFRGDGTFSNTLYSIYFDSGITGKQVELIPADANRIHMVSIIACQNCKTPADVYPTGTFASSAAFNIEGRSNFIGGSAPTSLASADMCSVSHFEDDGVLSLIGGTAYNSGRTIVSGSTYAGGINAVSNNGGNSAVINDDASAEFRVVKTPNGSSFTRLVSVDSSGIIRSDGPTQTTVGAAGGASAIPATPTGYLEFKIGATSYVIPYFAKA